MSSHLESWANLSERLHRENLLLKRSWLGAAILIAAALLMGQARTSKTVEAEAFVLKGSDGSVRARMATDGGLTQIVLYNSTGLARVTIRADKKGEALEMRDDSGQLCAVVDVAVRTAKSPSSSTIAALGTIAGPGVVMNASKDVAVLRVDNQDGRQVWAVSSHQDGAQQSR